MLRKNKPCPTCNKLIWQTSARCVECENITRRSALGITSKVCSICKQEKTLDLFAINKRRVTGTNSYCKECHNKKAREAYKIGYAKNKEKYLSVRREYRARIKVSLPPKPLKEKKVYTRKPATQERKEYLKNYTREWMRKRRSDFFSDKSCIKCGSKESLELDHIVMADKVDHKIWSWREERRLAEIAKCQVLCRKCHMEKTSMEVYGHMPYQHGTKSTYRNGCRCEKCMEIPKIYNEKRRR